MFLNQKKIRKYLSRLIIILLLFWFINYNLNQERINIEKIVKGSMIQISANLNIIPKIINTNSKIEDNYIITENKFWKTSEISKESIILQSYYIEKCSKNTRLLIAIISHPSNFKVRNHIRNNYKLSDENM